MNANRKKILVAVDGSGHAFDTVHYLSEILPPDRIALTLFTVLNEVPEGFGDFDRNPLGRHGATFIGDWQMRQQKAMEEFMEKVRHHFTSRGFPNESLTIKIQARKKGIARDIIRESQSGYAAVVAGRQGMNPITRLVIGSVAGKLIASLVDMPLWIVGKGAMNKKMLIATDASEGAMRAVAHVGTIVGGTNLDLTLFHVIRSFSSGLLDQNEQSLESENWVTKANDEAAIRSAFEKAAKVLEQAGFNSDQISAKVISGMATRSGSIVAQAMNGGYGTIVLGRRGYSKVGEFPMGRVTNKVMQLANNLAVWVVN